MVRHATKTPIQQPTQFKTSSFYPFVNAGRISFLVSLSFFLCRAATRAWTLGAWTAGRRSCEAGRQMASASSSIRFEKIYFWLDNLLNRGSLYLHMRLILQRCCCAFFFISLLYVLDLDQTSWILSQSLQIFWWFAIWLSRRVRKGASVYLFTEKDVLRHPKL